MTLDELRQKYPDLYQGKNDAEMVYTLSQVTGASPVRVAYDMGLDPSGFAQNEGTMDDLGTSLELGYEQTKRGLANLPNLPYALATGENLYETPEMDNEVARIQGTFSPGYQAAQREIGSAWDEGRYGDYALGLITNPGYTGNQLMQSGAPMVAGGIVGAGIRGVTALGALGSGMLARGAATAAPYIGEAVPSAAIQYKDLLDKDVDPRTAALTGLATGVGVGATAGLGGYLAGKAGYMDPEKFLAGMTRKVGDDTVPLSYKGQIGYGMLAEGAEEAVQSPWEEAMANLAQGKPWDEGLGRAAIEGGIAGGIIGGGFNALAPPLRRITPDQPTDLLQDGQQATPVPPGVNPPGDRTPHIDPLAAERQRQIDALMGGETSQTIRPGQADPGSLQGLTRDQINQRLIDAAMGGETARTFAPGQYPSDVAADLSQQQAKLNAVKAAEQAKKAVEKQYEKAGWQKTPEKIALLETAQAPKLVSGIYGDEARKFVDSVLTMDAKTVGELFTNLSGSKSKSAPWKAAIAKAHLTNLAQQEAQTLAQQAKQNDTVDGPGVPVAPTVAQNAQPAEGVVPPTPTTSSVVQDEVEAAAAPVPPVTPIVPPAGVNAVPEGGTPPVVPVPPPSPTTPETPTNALSGQTTPQAGQETGTTPPDAHAPGVDPNANTLREDAGQGGQPGVQQGAVEGGSLGELDAQEGRQTADAGQTQTKPTLNFSRSGQGQPAPGFFSQLKRVVERAKQTTMPGGQWKAWLKANQAQLGVKQEEIEATGIDEYLDARGKDKVTREEIAAFVENNGVRVEEVTKESDTAKFDKWQLPGGSNYKELLLTLPAKPTAQQAELETKRAALHEELRTAPVARQQEILAELDTLLPAMDRADQTASAGQYQSGHYSEPNILAHVRINERTDTEGKRVLFVEEIQSDWGQQGRNKGFRLPSRTWGEIDKELSEVSRKRSALIDEAASLPDSEMAKFRRLTGEADELGKRLLELRAEQDAIETNRDRVPTGPFVTNTKSWTALALKRLMTYAVENGFDRVAWTTGEQQAERYNLSKQISDIAWRGGNFVAWDKQGNEVVRQTGTTQQDVADYVGKEVADKLFSQTPQGEGRNALYQLSGEDLNVGGQGMKAFYGSIVPQVANDLLKKLGGGRVGSVAVNISKGKKTTASQQFGFDITPAMRAKVQGGLPLFARKPNKAKQTSDNTVADVERWIAGPKAKLAQWVTNGLNVVQSVDELRARYPGMDIPDDVVGMHEGGYVFLVADNITNANQARKALAHEVVGHLGLERMLGKKGFERIVRQIDSYIRTQNPAVLQALERVKAKYTDDQGKYNLNQVQEASEILAHLAERNPNFGLIREIIARIRMWFAKHGLGNYAAAELNKLLVEAARFTETGFTSFAEGNFRVAPAYMVAGGRPTQRSGVNAEVAPDPRRIKAGGDQTLQRWAELTYDDQLAITQTLGDSILPRLLQQMGAQDYRVEYTMGGFKGASNPSITIHFGQNVPYDLELEVANTLGVLWRQQAMIAYNEDDTSTGDQVQFVKVIPDRKLSVQEQRDLFANINRLYPQAEGVSTRDGALVFGNFVGATEREFHEGVRDAFNQLETKYNAEIPSFVFRSDWIEPPTLENTDYGQSYNTQTASGRDVLRRRQRNFDSLQSESDALFRAAVDATWQRGRRPNAGRDERAGGRDTESRYPIYGTARDKAVRAVGVHFSQTERQELDSSYYGTGLQGKEAQRVFAAADKRLRQRVYFYINSGAGITPEAGVGGHAHTVALNNLYDLNADPLRLLDLPTTTNANENTNLVESAILDAGFDGYVSDFGKQRAAVLIGRHTVPVRYEGMTKPEVPAGERAVPNDIKRIGEILGKTWVKRTPMGFRKVLMRENLGLYQAYADAFTGTGRTYWPDEMVREISKAYPPQREEQAAQPLPETITFDGTNPNINFMRGPTKQDASNLWDWIKTETEAGVEAFSRKVGLGTLTNEQMADRWGKEFAPLKTIANVLDATEAKAAQWEKKAEDADRDWAALTAEQDQLMSEIMGDASLHGYDPDTGQLPVGHISKEQRARVMAAKVTLDARWQRLKTLDANSKHKAVAVYRQVRDYHQQRLQEAINYVRAQLQQKGTVRPDDPLLKSLEALEAMGKRPYFPLMRLGDYYVVGMSPQMADLEKRFRAKQLQPDEDALRDKLRRDPKHYWVEGTARLATAKRLAEKLRKEMGFAQYNAERYKLANARSHVGQDVGKFEQALEGMALDTKTHDALVEMYEQLLISALPEHHSLKRTLHREGIYGWDKNMRAVFAKTAQTGAWALSRMMHVSDLQQAMSELDEMSKTGEPNAQDARALHNELLARQDLTFTRYEDPLLVQGAMKFSYLSMLGFSPAFWAINLTQPWMVTLPYLTARNGNEFKATSSALWRGVREAFSMIEASFEGKELRTQFNPDKVNQQGQKVRLTADERRMLDTFGADGTLDFTIGYDLGAIAKGGSDKWQKVMRSINAPTHATELANRVGTALAAYRISRQSQHSHEQALEFAKKAVNTTQVNYNPANKARYMQAWKGNRWLPKLVFQFYTYQQAMAYLALSTLRDAIKGDKVAQSTMAWMTGMLGATGGVFALPFAQMSLGAAGLIFSALGGGDDEEDVDFQRDLRNLFSDHLPKPVARLLNKGLGSMLLQTDLGARIGMGNLMNPLAFARFEAADKGADTVQEVLFRMGGAPVANIASAVDGLYAMRDVMGALVTGDAPKGSDVNDMFAKLFPLKGVRDIFRGNELFNEGVTTGEGEPRITDFSALETLIQGLGVTPLRKTMYYERNAAIQGAKEAMKIARGDLIREYAQARLAGEPIGPILAKIGAFNQRNPQHRIDQDTLKRSTTQRQKDRQSLNNGILANKENRPYLAAGRWAE